MTLPVLWLHGTAGVGKSSVGWPVYGVTFTRPSAGFNIGVATAWRYVREAIDLLAATADNLQTSFDAFRWRSPAHPCRRPARGRPYRMITAFLSTF